MDCKRITWTAVLTLAAGIVLLFFPKESLDLMVRCLGILFVLSGLINVGMQFSGGKSKDGSEKKRSISVMVAGVAALALGVWMLIEPAKLTNLFIIIISVLMILAGLVQIYSLAYAYKPVPFPGFFYILPILIIITGVVMLIMGPSAVANFFVRVTAIVLIVFAVSALFEVGSISSYKKTVKRTADSTSTEYEIRHKDGTVEDVEATEIHTTVPSEKKEDDNDKD